MTRSEQFYHPKILKKIMNNVVKIIQNNLTCLFFFWGTFCMSFFSISSTVTFSSRSTSSFTAYSNKWLLINFFQYSTYPYLPMYESIPHFRTKNEFFSFLGKNFLENLIFHLRIFFQECYGYTMNLSSVSDPWISKGQLFGLIFNLQKVDLYTGKYGVVNFFLCYLKMLLLPCYPHLQFLRLLHDEIK